MAYFVIIFVSLILGDSVSAAPGCDENSSAREYERLTKDPKTLTARLSKAHAILKEVPLIDGHNDLPQNIRETVQNQLSLFDFDQNLNCLEPWGSRDTTHTDLPKLRAGEVGGVFLAAYVSCEAQYKNALLQGLEQIDVIKRLIQKYPNDLALAVTAQDILDITNQTKIAVLIGVEGGHIMESSLATLRIMYEVGARYMTLTHFCDTPWAQMSGNEGKPDRTFTGLTEWGKNVVREMNRLGMLVDISHVSLETMTDVLDTTVAPVIFSHSSARVVCNNTRNVPDNILKRMASNGGVVMVNFASYFVSCSENSTIHQLIDHINHIKDVAGVDYVGLGSDYDGVTRVPAGLDDASTFPNLIAELLLDSSWTEADLKKLIGLNILRVMKKVEEVRDSLIDQPPIDMPIPSQDVPQAASHSPVQKGLYPPLIAIVLFYTLLRSMGLMK